MTEPAERQLRPRHLVIGVVAALLVGVVLVAGIGRLAGFADIRQTISGGDMRWLCVCVIGQLVVFAATPVRSVTRSPPTQDRGSPRRCSCGSCSPASR
jgi:hypothetical protein